MAATGYVKESGGGGGPVSWSDVSGKPSTFPPSVHTHVVADVTNLQTLLDGKAASNHTHAYGTLTGIPSTFAPSAHGHAWADIADPPATYPPDAHTHAYGTLTGIPATFTPSAHTHAVADVTNLQTLLDSKSDTGHTHAWASITSKPATFPPDAHTHAYGTLTGIPATFTPSAHTHVIADVTSLQSALDLKADLASPALTGNPTAPTQTAGNNTTRLATTAFVTAAVAAGGGGGSVAPETDIFYRVASLVGAYSLSTLPDGAGNSAPSTTDHTKVWVPAGRTIAYVGVCLHAGGTYTTNANMAGMVVYEMDGSKAGETAKVTTTTYGYNTIGWKFVPLTTPVASQASGRWVIVGTAFAGWGSLAILYQTASDGLATGSKSGTSNRRNFYVNSSAAFATTINPATTGSVTGWIPVVALAE